MTSTAIDDAGLIEVLRAGVAESNSGRPQAAEAAFRKVLDAVRGTGSKTERLAQSCLLSLYARQDRDVDSLVLARRHLALSLAAGDAEDICFSYAGICDALRQMEDWPRFDDAAAAFDGALSRYAGPHRGGLQRHLHRLRVSRHLAHGDIAAAREELRGIDSIDTAAGSPAVATHATLLCRAAVEVQDSRPETALEILRRAAALRGPAGEGAVEAHHLSVQCRLALEGPEAARAEIARGLDEFQTGTSAVHSTSERIRFLRRLGDVARKDCGDPDLAMRAYDGAAAAVLLRASQIEAAAREVPEFSGPEGEDASTLAAYRRRFVVEQAQMLTAVSRLLQAKMSDGGTPTWTGAGEDGTVGICAWCLRVRLPDGRMLPIGHFLPQDSSLRVSHGICRACAMRLTQSFGEEAEIKSEMP